MRKIIFTMIALMAIHCPLWAQNITAESTAQECLMHMGLIISGNDAYKQEYDFRGTRIIRTASSGDTTVLEHFIDVNWASYSELKVQKGEKDLIITVNFDDPHALYSQMKSGERMISREINRSNIIFFTFPPELSDRYLPEFRRGAERLRQLAKSDASPLLKLNRSKEWIKNIPTVEDYDKNLGIMARALAPWTIAFFDDRAGTAFAFVEYDSDGKEGQAVAFDSDMILSVKDDGKSFVFNALTRHRANPAARLEMRGEQTFTLPFTENRDNDDRSEMLKYFKLFLWENGVHIFEDGFKVDNLY